MAKQTLLPAISPSFQSQVASLAGEGKSLTESYAELTERTLKFAEQFKALWEQAKTLDKKQGGEHSQFLRRELTKAIQSADRSAWSKWIKIGSNAPKLLPHKEHIPHQRDALYELARAADTDQDIGAWVKQNQLTVESTVREVRSLRSGKKRSRAATATPVTQPNRSVRKNYPAAVTLNFDSFSTAARVLRSLFVGAEDFKVTTDKALANALRSLVDDDEYDYVKNRLI